MTQVLKGFITPSKTCVNKLCRTWINSVVTIFPRKRNTMVLELNLYKRKLHITTFWFKKKNAYSLRKECHTIKIKIVKTKTVYKKIVSYKKIAMILVERIQYNNKIHCIYLY